MLIINTFHCYSIGIRIFTKSIAGFPGNSVAYIEKCLRMNENILNKDE